MEGRTYKVHVCPVSGGGAVLLMLDATEEIARERLQTGIFRKCFP